MTPTYGWAALGASAVLAVVGLALCVRAVLRWRRSVRRGGEWAREAEGEGEEVAA